MQRKCFASWQQQQRKNEEKLAPRRRNWSAGQWRCISVSATTAWGKWCKRNNFLFFRSKLFPAWLKPWLYCPYYPVRPVCAVRDAVKKHQAPVSGSMRESCPHVHMSTWRNNGRQWRLIFELETHKWKVSEKVSEMTNWAPAQFWLPREPWPRNGYPRLLIK